MRLLITLGGLGANSQSSIIYKQSLINLVIESVLWQLFGTLDF